MERISSIDNETLTQRIQLLEDERDIRVALDRYGHCIDYRLEAPTSGLEKLRELFPYARATDGGISFQHFRRGR